MKSKFTLLFFLVLCGSVPIVNAQVIRGFNTIYSDNIRGGHAMFGNTAMAIYTTGSGSTGTVNTTLMNQFGDYGNSKTANVTNDQSNMQFTDIDGDASTSRSSSANLVLPAGTNTIRFARLYWGARINNSEITTNDANIRTIKLKAPGGGYITYTAPSGQIDKYDISTTSKVYQSYIDITSLVNTNQAGTYTVADMAGSSGNMNGGGGYFAGWTIVVVFENPAMNWASIRIYDGYLQVYDGGAVNTRSITLSGLNAPSGSLSLSDAYMSVMSWEGDGALAASGGNPLGDYIKINGAVYSDVVNPAANMWNGTISKNGSHVTTKSPNYLNQFGIDIDETQIGGVYGITGGTTQASIEFGTEADQYFPSLFAFTIKMQPPQIQINKTVADASGNSFVEKDEVLTFTIEGWDELSATGYAYNAEVTDTLSPALTYVPNSIKRWDYTTNSWVDVTDAEGDDCTYTGTYAGKTFLHMHVGTGACAATGGILVQGQHFKVKFQASAKLAMQISNVARMYANSESGDTYTDDAFAVMGANQAPLAIRLVSFNGTFTGSAAQLNWEVAAEINTAFYEIQRSEDGVNFKTTGLIDVNGSCYSNKTYHFTDAVASGTAIYYYRLKETGMNGTVFFSDVLKLNNSNALFRISNCGPNPFHSYIQFQAILKENTSVEMKVMDVNGAVLLKKHFNAMKGNDLLRVDQLDHLPSGIYLIEMILPDGMQTFRLVKQ